jgi:hypothetical protein
MTNCAARSAALAVAAVVAAGAVPAAAKASLIARWKFDESAGQVVHDDGPFGLDGVLGLKPAPDAADPERIGGALRFDGTSVVRLPDSSRLAPQHLTVEAVARADGSPGSYRYLVSKGGTGCYSGSYGLYTAPKGGLALYVFDGSRYVLSATARRPDVWDGSWHTVKGTFDGNALRLFVDGREVGSPMVAPISIDYSTPTDAATLGQYAGPCDLGFRGDIDLVQISSDAVDAAAPDTTPDAPSGPLPPPLPAAAPGTTLPGPETSSERPNGSSKPCTVRLARRSVVAGRRTVVRAQLLNAAKRSKLRLTARRGTRRKVVASARISSSGHARLVVRSQQVGHLTVRVVGRTGCASARLTVTRP